MDKYSWPEPQRQVAFPIAEPGYPLILALAFITAVFAHLGFAALAIIGLIATLFVCYFFRDPDRVVPDKTGAVVSPADGRIVAAGEVDKSPMGQDVCMKISIFMSVFNVHVNRIPYAGTISNIMYRPGGFFPADLDRASRENEQNAVFIDVQQDKKICVVQVAGLIARRIICKIQAGDVLLRGQRFGMICFGSRVDVYLPSDTILNVAIGDRVKAGTSIIGHLA